MGMFDKPQYLTGKDGEGFVQVGDVFWLHNAKIDGTVNINGENRTQAKLLVSHEKGDKPEVVFTSGRGIVGQIQRMDQDDRAAFPMELRLDAIPSGRGQPTNVLTPADQDPPGTSVDGGFEAGF